MISLILPVCNEEGNLPGNLKRIVRELMRLGQGYEVIIAEDGSTDGTYPIARNLSRRYDNVRVSHSGRRLGKGLAIKRALPLTRGDRIAYMDIDLSTDVTRLGDMFRYLDRYDIVIGSRLIRRDMARRSMMRYLFSVSYNLIIRILFRSGIRDHQCGFKAFRRDVILGLAGQARNDRWFFDTEILVMAKKAGFRIKELPVRWSESKESKIRINRIVFQMLSDIAGFLLRQG